MSLSNPGVTVTKLILRLEALHGADAPEDTVPGVEEEPLAPADHPETVHVVDLGERARQGPTVTPLARWIATVAAAHDSCLVLDESGQIVSISTAATDLLGCADSVVIGRRLLDVVELVDFETGGSRPDYAPRIAPVAVLAAGSGLMRSLIRLRQSDGSRVTIDASAAPIHDARGETVGSVTFLAPVRG